MALQKQQQEQEAQPEPEPETPAPTPDPAPGPPVVTISGSGSVFEGEDAVFDLVATPAQKTLMVVAVEINHSRNVLAAKEVGMHYVAVRNGKGSLVIPTIDDSVAERAGSVIATIVWRPQYARPNAVNGFAKVSVENNDVPPELPKLSSSVSECVSSQLHENVQAYSLEGVNGREHVDRWNRVLAAFGVLDGLAKMTIAEAQGYKDKGWRRWDPVVTALQCLENKPPEAPTSLGEISVEDTWTKEGYLAELWVSYTNNDPDNRCLDYRLHTHEGSAKLNEDFWEGTYARVDHTACANQGGTARIKHMVRTRIDSHDEPRETFQISLSIPAGRSIEIVKGIATVTIVNDGPIPGEYLARFGHSVAGNLTSAIADRVTGRHTPGFEGSLGALPEAGQTIGLSQSLAGAAASATTETGLSVWGKIAESSFSKDVHAISGEQVHMTAGVDYRNEDWLFGVAMDHSTGDGELTRKYDLDSTLVSVAPYLAWHMTDGTTLWGSVGYGRGDVSVKYLGFWETSSDTDWAFSAAGSSTSMYASDGLNLDLVSDLFYQSISSDATENYGASDMQSMRVSAGLEASATFGILNVQPSMKLRRDLGDLKNETALGLGLAAGIGMGPATLTADVDRTVGGKHDWKHMSLRMEYATARGTPHVSMTRDTTTYGWKWTPRDDLSLGVSATPESKEVHGNVAVRF